MHGGAADRSGLISCGDEVIEVNGVNVEGKTPNDVLKILVRYQLIRFDSVILGFKTLVRKFYVGFKNQILFLAIRRKHNYLQTHSERRKTSHTRIKGSIKSSL